MRCVVVSCVAAVAAVASSCATSVEDLGYAVTDRDGGAELIVALCGAEPPTKLVVARAPTGGIQDMDDADFANLPEEEVLFEVDESGWESDERAFPLGDRADAPPDRQGVMVYVMSNNARGRSSGWTSMPDAPWPEHPPALTSALAFERPVRLDTERGDLCEPG